MVVFIQLTTSASPTLVSQLTRFVTSSQFSPAGSATLVPIRPQCNTYHGLILQIRLVPHSFPAPTCAFPRYHQQGTAQGLSERWCIDQVASCQNGIAHILTCGMSWYALLVWVLMGCDVCSPLGSPSSRMSIHRGYACQCWPTVSGPLAGHPRCADACARHKHSCNQRSDH